LRCWGHNDFGQLGSGTPSTMASVPLDVMRLADASQIDLGNNHSCAARTSGLVSCWGDGANGRLGTGDETQQPAPTDTMFANAAEVACGYDFTCVRGTDRSVSCVGSNGAGQLGSEVGAQSLTPVLVPGVSAISLSAPTYGTYACAVRMDETVVCWGNNSSGQLGDGTQITRSQPMAVPGLSEVLQLTTGTDHACALLRSGQVLCWGSNVYGELGIGGYTPSTTPVRVVGL